MKRLTLLLVLLMAALLVTPVAAVTYSEEYYKLGNISTTLDPHNDVVEYFSKLSVYTDVRYLYITTLELRRQTILMEKQNELLEEQNGLMRSVLNRTYTTECVSGVCSQYNIVPVNV